MNISKTNFIKLIDNYQKTCAEIFQLEDLLEGSSNLFEKQIYRFYEAIQLTTELTDDLDYFIVDLDCGKRYYEGCYKVDGKNVDLSTPAKFYDFIVERENFLMNQKPLKEFSDEI